MMWIRYIIAFLVSILFFAAILYMATHARMPKYRITAAPEIKQNVDMDWLGLGDDGIPNWLNYTWERFKGER